MPLLAVGTNHRTAPLEIRERLAFTAPEYGEVMAALRQQTPLQEAVLISTCNRTELYGIVAPDEAQSLQEWLCQRAGLSAAQGRQYLYTHHNADAVSHLFQVASGLDSLVLGEPQILGQLKAAWQLAHEVGGMGKITDRLFQQAFSVGKEVRHQTGISSHPVSVPYITTVLARKIFGDLSQSRVLLVGAGEMIELCARHFRQQGVGQLTIANRSLDRAQDLAERMGATAVGLEQIGQVLADADILISSTAAREPVVTTEAVKAALRTRRQRPMFLVDIAVPRDIEAAVADLENAYLYTIDDLQQVAEENQRERGRAADQGLDSVQTAVAQFMRWLHGARAADSLQRLRAQADRHGSELAHRALKQLESGKDPQEVLQQMASTLSHRIMHVPSKRLRQAAEEQEYGILKAADWLFDSSIEPLAKPAAEADDEPAS